MPCRFFLVAFITFQARWVSHLKSRADSLSEAIVVAWVVSARPYGFSGGDRRGDRVDLDHGVVLAVDVEIELGDQEVLVERGVGPGVDHRPVRRVSWSVSSGVVTIRPVARTSHSMLPSV